MIGGGLKAEFDRFTDELQSATKFNDELFVDGALATDISTLQLFDQFARQQNVEGQVYVALASLPASARTEATPAACFWINYERWRAFRVERTEGFWLARRSVQVDII